MDHLIPQVKEERRWHVKSQLIYLFHSAKQTEYGTRRPFGWTVEKTATALGLSAGYVSEAIQLAKHYKERPDSDLSRESALRLLHEAKRA